MNEHGKSAMAKIPNHKIVDQLPKISSIGKPTISGFSSGGFKTAYILNNLPKTFAGYGILSGSFGDISYWIPVKHVWTKFVGYN